MQRTFSTSSFSPSQKEIKPFQPNSTSVKSHASAHNPHVPTATLPSPRLQSRRMDKRWSLQEVGNTKWLPELTEQVFTLKSLLDKSPN